jgi:hypothetical protein
VALDSATIQKIVSKAFAGVSGLTSDVYYFQATAATYDPATGSFTHSGEINISDIDLSIDGDDSKLSSVLTDLSSIPVDGTYVKISGFTESENNGFKQGYSITDANNVIFSNPGFTTEIAGDSVSIYGPYHHLKGIKRLYTSEERRDSAVLDKDERLTLASYDLSITPKPADIVYTIEDSTVTEWNIISVGYDSQKSIYILQIRRP